MGSCPALQTGKWECVQAVPCCISRAQSNWFSCRFHFCWFRLFRWLRFLFRFRFGFVCSVSVQFHLNVVWFRFVLVPSASQLFGFAFVRFRVLPSPSFCCSVGILSSLSRPLGFGFLPFPCRLDAVLLVASRFRLGCVCRFHLCLAGYRGASPCHLGTGRANAGLQPNTLPHKWH